MTVPSHPDRKDLSLVLLVPASLAEGTVFAFSISSVHV